MIKRSIFIALLTLFFSSVWAQKSVICPSTFQDNKGKGLWAVEVFGGAKEWSGWEAGGGFLYFLPSFGTHLKHSYSFPNKFIRLNGFIANDRYRIVKHTAKGVDLMFGYTPFNVNNIFFGSILVGLTYSSDNLKSGEIFNETIDDLSLFKPGGIVGMEMSTFLSPNSNISIVGSFTQRVLLEESWGNWRWYATVGVRYHFTVLSR